MISFVQPLFSGNALRLFLRPPTGAVYWKVLRKASNVFSGADDPAAVEVFEGDELVIVDSAFLQNEVMVFYCPFYSADDGATWLAGPVASGTPLATYEEQTSDVQSVLRERLELGLLVEVQRGNLTSEIGCIQVTTATPSVEQDLRFPLVTVHLEGETPTDRALGEYIGGDDISEDSEGWLANVSIRIVGASLNGDERIELRKAIRRVIAANFSLFDDHGWLTPNLAQESDEDAVGGEYPASMYFTSSTFTCVAPVRVSARAPTVRDVISQGVM